MTLLLPRRIEETDGTGYLEQLWLHEIEHDEQWGLLIPGLCEEGLLNH